MPPALQALLLDAVGALIETAEPAARVYARVAKRHGIAVPESAIAPVLRLRLAHLEPPPLAGVLLERIAELEREAWRELVRSVLGERAASGPCFEELFAHYARPEAWRPLAGVREALALAHGRGLSMAVVSNMDARLGPVLGGLGLVPPIDTILIPSSCGLAKPDPRIFHLALERLGCSRESALYIGDREERCVAAARAAGLRAVRYAPETCASDPTRLARWADLAGFLGPGAGS